MGVWLVPPGLEQDTMPVSTLLMLGLPLSLQLLGRPL